MTSSLTCIITCSPTHPAHTHQHTHPHPHPHPHTSTHTHTHQHTHPPTPTPTSTHIHTHTHTHPHMYTHTVEFPAVLLDLCTGEIVSEFQQYVQPQENPRLCDFCRELTGITQVCRAGPGNLPSWLSEYFLRMSSLTVNNKNHFTDIMSLHQKCFGSNSLASLHAVVWRKMALLTCKLCS